MTPRHPSERRAGFTLIEMMMAVTLMLMVFAAAVPFFRSQARSIDEQAGRFDATQTARFAISTVDKDLRVSGNWLGTGQPLLVQADSLAITFNADLLNNTFDAAAPYNVYTDSTAPAATVEELTAGAKITLPNSTRLYPDSTYRRPGTTTQADAETISYYVTADTRPGYTGYYQLRRRVNADSSTLVAERVTLPAGERVFRYYYVAPSGTLTEVPTTKIPMFHTAIMHGAANDTGPSRMTDSVRVVRMRLTVADVDARRGTRTQTFESNIRLRNAGLLHRASCGATPTLGFSSITATATTSSGVSKVTLKWSRATDELGGEKDIQSYVIYRRDAATTTFSGVFDSVPADGSATYTYVDTKVTAGQSYYYGIAAVDCTPLESGTVTSSKVTP